MNQLNPQNYFQQTGGSGAPSALLKNVNDFVYGEIVDQLMVPQKDFATGVVEKDARTGEDLEQLMIIIQTDSRGWAKVSKIPEYPAGDARAGQQKDPAEDDGKRAIYVPAFRNLHAAIGDATGNEPLLNGGKLGVKIIELRNTGKGNPLKIHQAVYTPPVASEGFFPPAEQAAPAPAAPAPAAPAPAAPAPAAPAPAAPAPAAPAPAAPASDPWGTPVATEAPPF
jgi:hypothetical protein